MYKASGQFRDRGDRGDFATSPPRAGVLPHGRSNLSRWASVMLTACVAASGTVAASPVISDQPASLVQENDPDAGAATPGLIGAVRERAGGQDAVRPPFWRAGQALQSWGITPTLVLTQMYLANPSAGQDTGNHEALTFVAVGADLDLQRIVGIAGATLHFQQLFLPSVVNTTFGGQVGDSIAGQPMPYVPRKAHLTLLAWEQRFLQDRLAIELGKSNAQNHFGLSVCELPFGCYSSLLQDNAGINPPPYANWSARIAYRPVQNVTVQAGVWRSDRAFPFSNGWERSRDTPHGTTYLANLVYRTDPSQDRHAGQYEFLLFHSTATQANPAYTASGASRAFNPAEPAATTKGASGIYAGGKQVVWRADGATPGTPGATSLALFGSVANTFDQKVATGLQTTATAGVTLKGLVQNRPADSVSARLMYSRLTADEQTLLQDANLAAGGAGYTVGRNEFALGLDATIVATPSVIVSPYVQRTFNANTWLNPYHAGKPRDGIVFGILATVLLDKMLGLAGH